MQRALIFWFTGLSGSGKSSVANGSRPFLEDEGYSVLILDGDDIRRRLHTCLGFSEADVKKNNILIAELCQRHRDDYDVILVPIISPYAISRSTARSLLGEKFHEIYFSCGLETVIKRDVKGLYSKAERNKIHDLIGYSPGSVYEVPQNPDFVVNSQQDSVEKSVRDFYKFVIGQLKLY